MVEANPSLSLPLNSTHNLLLALSDVVEELSIFRNFHYKINARIRLQSLKELGDVGMADFLEDA